MKKILTIISGVALTAAAVITVVALTAGGTASAQDAVPAQVSESPIGGEAIGTLTEMADDLIDTLVAEGAITEEQADEARAALKEAQAKLDDVDWDAFHKQLELGIDRFKQELENADWDDIRRQLEDAVGELDSAELEEFDFDPDSIDWSELEGGFDQFKDEFRSFDLDEARKELQKHLGEVDWDDLSSKFNDGLQQFDFDQLRDRADQLKKRFEGMDWDDLRKQFEGQFDGLSSNA
jgi:polyhydroxyalkanoate synthesis regulator phasin